MVHCFFEQSGTFKNEFKKLGIEAKDYDILNDFNQTDKVIDLFNEIELAYDDFGGGLFKDIKEGDIIFAFFPCIRFEAQQIMNFKGKNSGMKKRNKEDVLAYNLMYHRELHRFYELITKLVIICRRRKIPLILENPYTTQHFLTRYWCIEPTIIDYDRAKDGDYYTKPTQYWFINCKPQNTLVFDEAIAKYPLRKVIDANTVERSMISPDYARRFIRQYLLDENGELLKYEK